MPIAQKTESSMIDGTPEKRMFWSIISDYDLETGLCELIDNAIDLWTDAGREHPLRIEITLDAERQLICVTDNAGGVKHEDLRLLVAPGGSRNDPNAEIIGIFGVGGKRASIALGEHVEIRTRYKKQQTYQVDITKGWLEIDDWNMPAYAVPNIEAGTTTVEISYLRKPFSQSDADEIVGELEAIYSWFLQKGCSIAVDGATLSPKTFDHWAYPKGFPPRCTNLCLNFGNEKLTATITAGLITDRDPEKENYGVYIYCNHRLIVKELRTRDVGYFVTAEAGVPHPDASMCRVIVDMNGPAKLMPWNSSKSNINSGHVVFKQLRPILIQFAAYFSSLSRRLKNDWGEKVTPFTVGSMEVVKGDTLLAGKRLHLPELPRVNKARVEHLKTRNKKILKDSPWTVGLVEAVAAVEVISRQKLDTKNRIALILLDSNFEIALKEFIVHRTDLFPASAYSASKIQQLFKYRNDVIDEVVAKVTIPNTLLVKASHYYGMRNKLIHERATVGITDTDVENYRTTTEKILSILFKLKF